MFAEFYAQSPLLFWPLVGLVIFLAAFAAVLLYVLIGLRDQRKVDYMSALPLEPDRRPSTDSSKVDLSEESA